jgi:glycosyltransferase involved in cell wall biosynthesis
MDNLSSPNEHPSSLNYLENNNFSNLQISSYDLIGNKFNGHNLHIYLRDKGIASKQVVLKKESNDENTYQYNFHRNNSTKDLLRTKYFLESDIIHLHIVHNIIDLNYLPIMSRLKPTLITLHDPFFLGGHCVHHFDCEKWKNHCEDCPYLKEPFPLESDYSALNFELKKQAIQNSKITAIVASKWMENKVKQSPIWIDKKIYHLPFGVDQKIFTLSDKNQVRKKMNLPVDSKIILFRADNSSYKGFDIIMDSLIKLKSKEKIILLTVGIRGLLKDLKNNYQIIEYGWINNDELLANLYQSCDIFLMPSKQETFGMMAIEAMSCGKTVLSIHGQGTALPEIINSPNCGLAVNEIDFAVTLQRLLDNSSEINERNQNSQIYAKEHYSLENYLDQLIDIYKEAITNHEYDASSSLILNQLWKYSIGDPINEIGQAGELNENILFKVKKYTKNLLNKTPNNIQNFFYPILSYLFRGILSVISIFKK